MQRVTDDLYIGSATDAADHPTYTEYGINAVVNLAYDDPADGYPEHVTVHRHAFDDGSDAYTGTFHNAVTTVLNLLDDGNTVLVHCHRGISRSGSVTAAVIAARTDASVTDAVDQIAAVTGEEPHPTLVSYARIVQVNI